MEYQYMENVHWMAKPGMHGVPTYGKITLGCKKEYQHENLLDCINSWIHGVSKYEQMEWDCKIRNTANHYYYLLLYNYNYQKKTSLKIVRVWKSLYEYQWNPCY